MTVVELDKDMVDVATEWFSLRIDKRLRVIVQDALSYLEDLNKKGMIAIHNV